MKTTLKETKKYDKLNEFIIFDVETTGLKPEVNEIIEFSAQKCKFEDGKVSTIGEPFDIYIKIPYSLPQEIVDLTGITDDVLKTKGISKKDAYTKIKEYFGDTPIVGGYNVAFDIKFVNELYKCYGDIFKDKEEKEKWGSTLISSREDILDVYLIAKELISSDELSSKKLALLSEYLKITDNLQFHASSDDIIATYMCLERMYQIYLDDYKNDTKPKEKVDVIFMSYWSPSHDRKRIYTDVKTNNKIHNIYYDVNDKSWKDGKYSKVVDSIDVDDLTEKATEYAKDMGYKDLAHFTLKQYK